MPESKRRLRMPVEEISQQLAPYAEAFEKLPQDEVRRVAFEKFVSAGFPTSREEDWKFTNLAPLTRIAFEPADGADPTLAERILRTFPEGPRIVFVNGHRLSAPQTPSKEVGKYACDGAFVSLNTAMFTEAAIVHVRGMQNDPIHVIHISLPGARPAMAHPRNLFVFESGAQGSIIETYVGDGV